jgi:hypothetical protein
VEALLCSNEFSLCEYIPGCPHNKIKEAPYKWNSLTILYDQGRIGLCLPYQIHPKEALLDPMIKELLASTFHIKSLSDPVLYGQGTIGICVSYQIWKKLSLTVLYGQRTIGLCFPYQIWKKLSLTILYGLKGTIGLYLPYQIWKKLSHIIWFKRDDWALPVSFPYQIQKKLSLILYYIWTWSRKDWPLPSIWNPKEALSDSVLYGQGMISLRLPYQIWKKLSLTLYYVRSRNAWPLPSISNQKEALSDPVLHMVKERLGSAL